MATTSVKTPEQLSQEASERIALASAQAQKQVEEARVAADPAPAPLSEDLEEQIKRILAQAVLVRSEAPKEEPDWSKVTEQQALDLNSAIYIPVIEHDIPAYMDIRLEDDTYDVVWAAQDQRRLGQLQAEGYEFLKPEHISKAFKLPLKFDSEGMYRYQDCIAMRVHKRILYGKRRKVAQISTLQLKRRLETAKDKVRADIIDRDSHLGEAFHKGSLKFF